LGHKKIKEEFLMTNTKFRKKALMSSVAMLIVALIALGSATFAWYQSNPTATASGATFTTNATSGLLVTTATRANNDPNTETADEDDLIPHSTATDGQLTAANNAAGFANTASFGTWGNSLQPASFDPTYVASNITTGKFRTTSAAQADEADMATGAAISDGTAGTHYIEEMVYFKVDNAGSTNAADVYLEKVTITSSTDMASAVRVVVYDNTGAAIAEFAPTADDYAKYLSATAIVGDGSTTGKVVKGSGVPLGNNHIKVATASKTADDDNGCYVRVYLDGFDSYVHSAGARTIGGASAILSNIEVSFSMTTTG
jgi:hypothetical protein